MSAAGACLVTGAFGHLGQAVCATLWRAGFDLALVDRAQAAAPAPWADDADRKAPLVLGGVDLTDAAQAEAAVQRASAHFGRLAAVVNLAGGFRWETVAGGDTATWDLMYRMNVLTALHTARAALPLMQAAGGGHIVNVGAGAAVRAGLGMGAYAASKAGVQRLTEALAEEAKDHGIHVNAVLPSILDTPTNRRDMPEADFGRWVAPEALADVVLFLIGPGARALHGAAIAVNGRV